MKHFDTQLIFDGIEQANFPLKPIYMGLGCGMNITMQTPKKWENVTVMLGVPGQPVRLQAFRGWGVWTAHVASWQFSEPTQVPYDVIAEDEQGRCYWAGRGQLVVMDASIDGLPPEAPPEGYTMRDSEGRLYRLTVEINELGQSTLALTQVNAVGEGEIDEGN